MGYRARKVVRVRTVVDAGLGGTVTESATHPLVSSASTLAGLDTRVRLGTDVPVGPTWTSLAEAASPELIRGHLDVLGGHRRGMRTVAAAQFDASLACTVVRPLMALLHTEHRVPVLRPEHTYVRAPDGGRFDALALRPGLLTALPSDPAAGHPAVRAVSDMDDLVACAADTIDTALTPVLRTVRIEGRYGLPQLWGAVLDMIGATSLLTARIAGIDQQRAWAHAQRLCQLVQERVEQERACHPRPFSVTWSGGEALYTVKGTCCLRYREHGLRAGDPTPDDAEDTAYCKTCPFLRDDTRRLQCRDQMEREAACAD